MVLRQAIGDWSALIVVLLTGWLVAGPMALPASTGAESGVTSAKEPKIQSLRGAFDFATEDGRIPVGLKLEAINFLQIAADAHYTLTFRDGSHSRVIMIRDNGDFKTKTQAATEGKPGFWASALDAVAVIESTEQRVAKAKAEAAKTSFEPGDILMVEYRTGFRKSDGFKEQWMIHLGLRGELPKGKVKSKTITFEDDRITKMADAELRLHRRPF
jgi:hypothetical protein